MNSVVLVGRLTKDPVLRYTPNDNRAVADFTLAINREFSRDEADFIRIVVWGKQAENAANYLKRGARCAIQGRIQTGSYTNKDGATVYTTDVVANRVEFLERAGTSNESPMMNNSNNNVEEFRDIDDSDIPF